MRIELDTNGRSLRVTVKGLDAVALFVASQAEHDYETYGQGFEDLCVRPVIQILLHAIEALMESNFWVERRSLYFEIGG